MANYRNISLGFWSDSKVLDEFEKDDKYIFLYLLTNNRTRISGCYELSKNQAVSETKMSWEEIEKVILRLESVFDVLRYEPFTHEVLILNWKDYNWTSTSEKVRIAVLKDLKNIKTERFKEFLELSVESKFDGADVPDSPAACSASQEPNRAVVRARVQRITQTDIVRSKGFSEPLENAVLEWVKYKTEKRQGYKETGLNNLLATISNKCTEFGEAAVISVIHESMSANWQGICWDRIRPGDNGNGSASGRLGFLGESW